MYRERTLVKENDLREHLGKEQENMVNYLSFLFNFSRSIHLIHGIISKTPLEVFDSLTPLP